MQYDRATYEAVKKWKRRLLIGGSLVLGLGLVGCGAGAYGLYSVGKHVSQSISVNDLKTAIPDVNAADLGPVSDVTLSLMGDWVATSLESGEAQSVKRGLSCIDALGGPDAGSLLRTLSERAPTAAAAESMRKAADGIPAGSSGRGVASCVSFMAG